MEKLKHQPWTTLEKNYMLFFANGPKNVPIETN
jgi:hypothetical protein